MRKAMVPEAKMLRHPICVRWGADDHKLVTDMAWDRRMRVSELIRQLVLEGVLRKTGVQGTTAKQRA